MQAPPTGEPLADAPSEVLSNPLYDDPALRLTPRLSDPAAAPAAAVPVSAPAAQALSAKQPSGSELPGSMAAAPASAGAGQARPQAPAAAASLLPAAACGSALVKGFPMSEALPLAAALPAGPGGLSILYENQAMRMERAELKSELKLISARVGEPAPCFCFMVLHGSCAGSL